MKYRLFTILSALSLLLCAGVAVLWVRSFIAHDALLLNLPASHWQISSFRGRVWTFKDTRLRAAPTAVHAQSAAIGAERMEPHLRELREFRNSLAMAENALLAVEQRIRTGATGLEQVRLERSAFLDAASHSFDRMLVTFRPVAAAQLGESRLGIYWSRTNQGGAVLLPPFLAVPHWLLLTLTALPLVSHLLLRRLIRQRRQIRNLCLICAYDLRATPDRCPECGQSTPHPHTEAAP